MPVHDADQELRLRHIEIGLPPFSLHEASSLLACPCSLSFVEHNNFLNWNTHVPDVFIAEVMDVLDEAAYLALGRPFRDSLAPGFVSCQSFPQNVHQWTIARKKNRVLVHILKGTPSRDVETRQGLTGTWNAGNKTDGFSGVLPS